VKSDPVGYDTEHVYSVMVLPEKTGGENPDQLAVVIMRHPSIAHYYFILQLLFTFGRDDILKGPWLLDPRKLVLCCHFY